MVALIGADVSLTYADVRQRVDEAGISLDLPPRSLVVLAGENSIEWVTTYLALLDQGHVPLLAANHPERLVETWQPNAVVDLSAGRIEIDRRHTRAIELHPDLALLLSTSGSTGNPKLVRLSHANLTSNASAIADYLDLGPGDRAITSLPLHYCYGLSVLHSHLEVGASVVIQDASVVDPCFHKALVQHGVTNLAGVPHSFDLLERVGVEQVATDAMRFVTQAGGRLSADAVDRWRDRLAGRGIDLFVMYGQTEATARMSFLPPSLTAAHPQSIGVPIPGGAMHLDRVGEFDGVEPDAGELVYRGPNVMLGYAETEADLALGRVIDELRTGDLARFDSGSGIYTIVGRRARFVKPFGVRIDLDQVASSLGAELGVEVEVTGDDTHIRIVAPDADPQLARDRASTLTAIPPAAILAYCDRPVPRTSSGKADRSAILAWPRPVATQSPPSEITTPSTETAATAVLASVLGRSDIEASDTFVSLGGDSLSYIECSIRLERVLGSVPTDWHHRRVSELVPSRRQRLARVDTTVMLRAVAIAAIVAAHMGLLYSPGGAHLLLGVVGYNTSRFLLGIDRLRERSLAGLRTVARVALPTMVWTMCGMALGAYALPMLLLINNYVGPPGHTDDRWHFWFIEVFVHLVLLTTLLLAIPAVRRLERRFDYLFALGLLALVVTLRYDWTIFGQQNLRFRTHGVAVFFVLGWLIERSSTRTRNLVTSAVIVASIFNFFSYDPRNWFIIIGLVTLVWFRNLAVPRIVVRPLATLAAASLWILVSHFTIWPYMVDAVGLGIAYPLTLLAGIVVWAIASRLVAGVERAGRLTLLRWRRDRRSPVAHATGEPIPDVKVA